LEILRFLIMRILLQTLLLLLCAFTFLQASDPVNDKKANAVNKVLIVVGGQSNMDQAFASVRRNQNHLSFETKSYPVHEKFGAGNNVTIDLDNLDDFGYVFISIDQGTLSQKNLQELSKYIKNGGRVFMLWDSNQRDCFSETMASNANELLSLLKIRDEIKLERIKFEPFSHGSILPISDKTRKRFTTQKSIKWMKNQGNSEYTAYKATMKSGHCFYKGSDLSAASLILEFNNQNGKYHTGAFWQVGEGVLGIGTEKMTSGEAPRNAFRAGDIVWESLNLDNPSEGFKEILNKPAKLKFKKSNSKKRRTKSR